MIPLYKLENLPRTQKLRKIAKILMMAERRLELLNNPKLTAEVFTSAELVFFFDAAKLLAEDSLFSPDAKKKFKEAEEIFLSFLENSKNDAGTLRRTLNSIKHILLMETGKDQADWDFTDSEGKLDLKKRQIFKGMQVYLEDIRSPFNVGAMFRTAESFGAEKIILSPFCADPHHRRAERTAMGCIDIITWERRELFASQEISQSEFSPNTLPPQIFALETGGVPISEFQFPRYGILIAGSEELGVSPQALEAADASLGRVSIPCFGTKASLNVSVAFGIAMQAWAAYLQKF
ncbi:MAG: TrmH family RNA methyltransferase [Treponema sp.]|nr:TrmH family RNA methyltransferase [Treponema sp.]MCL2250499.1 TrmH family RNA methyltransferase [Treponema sp.]